jgi:hypothetical protein
VSIAVIEQAPKKLDAGAMADQVDSLAEANNSLAVKEFAGGDGVGATHGFTGGYCD